jgi:acyl-coenzyme A synthetase/AMP-(fatty) acid ligase
MIVFDYPDLTHRSFFEHFEEVCKKNSDSIAYIHNYESITFGELYKQVINKAKMLIEKGVRRNTRIGLIASQGIGCITSILAIMRCVSIFVPIDENLPSKRIDQYLKKAKISFVINENNSNYHNENTKITTWDQSESANVELPQLVSDNQAAYILFTSGSTGEPKGAVVNYTGFLNHLQSKIDLLNSTSNRVIAQTAPISFDISIWQQLLGLTIEEKTIVG